MFNFIYIYNKYVLLTFFVFLGFPKNPAGWEGAGWPWGLGRPAELLGKPKKTGKIKEKPQKN